jgi:GNAT superfamily N-acetyltransferase
VTLKVAPLTPTTWPALAALFAQGGDPKSCACMWWRMPNQEWQSSSADDRYAALSELAGSAEPPGLVGLIGDEAAAWVSLGPRPAFGRLQRSRTLPAPELDSGNVWAVVCLVVGKAHRRKGYAAAMLEAAVAHARSSGATSLIGYPVDTEGDRVPAANVYTGTLSMFRDAGFDVVTPTTSSTSGKARILVERTLT